MSISSEASTTTDRRARNAALDGLRGITIVMVVLAHGWILWPTEDLLEVPVLRGFFLGGTVTVFFVIGAYIVAHGLLRDLDRGSFDALRFFVRRFVRLGAQLAVLCAAVLVVARYDETADPGDGATQSVVHILTYTWNLFLVDEPLVALPDLGHLWYLSVQQQWYMVLPLLLVLLHRRPRAAVLLLAAGIVAVVSLRYLWWDELGWWPISLDARTRGDGLLLGVLLAFLVPLVARRGASASRLLNLGLLAMLALVLIAGEVGEYPYLTWWGVLMMLAAGMIVAGIALGARGRATSALAFGPLARLGKASYSIYLWHYPLFWFIARHTEEWRWFERFPVAFMALAVVVVVMELVVEEPVRRYLASSPLARMRPAEPATAVGSR